MQSLGTIAGALPSGGLVFQLVCCFHRYWAHSSKSTVRPKMESCSQDGACSVCFLLQSDSATPWTTSTPGFPVLHHLPELAQTHVLWVGDAIQPSHPLSSPSPLVGGNRQNRLYLESRTPSWVGLWTLSYVPSIYGNNIPTGKPDLLDGRTPGLIPRLSIA